MDRIRCIDYLKTIAIIGVFLFHAGLIDNGYLGVEVFFVISGFLFIKGIRKELENKSFAPIKFVISKISTFWPMIAIGGMLALIIGYFNMLPDDYENLAESVIASNIFLNNILQAITTKNYWDVVNIYKPLMHTWYIGVLLQSFVFLAIVLWIASKISKKDKTRNILIIVSLISFVLYMLPIFSASDKFYYFPFRLFEITVGSLIAYIPPFSFKGKINKLIGYIGIGIMLFAMFSNIYIPKALILIIVVAATALILYTHGNSREDYGINDKVYAIVTLPGRYSYDFYMWHQIIIAFLYYSFFQVLNAYFVFWAIGITILMSMISAFLRKKISFLRKEWRRIILSFCIVTFASILSMMIYLHAGVVRDVPELGIDFNNVHRHMHSEYVDIPYSWDNDFTDMDKIHVLVLGDSFGRDFANILNESDYSDKIEISYIYGNNVSSEMDRVEKADFVFYGTSGSISETLSNIPKEKLYIVGKKGFGNSNGIIYFNRNKSWYFTQKVTLPDEMIMNNNILKGIYGDHYIDMLSPLLDGNEIRVFTDNNYYISQDCRHLTQQGAQYYSRILNLDPIFNQDK